MKQKSKQSAAGTNLLLTSTQKQIIDHYLPNRYCLISIQQAKQINLTLQQPTTITQTQSTDEELSQLESKLNVKKLRQKKKSTGKNIYWNCDREEDMKICELMLKELKRLECSKDFEMPVDPISTGVPHYYRIVKEPMDLQTISCLLKNNKYNTKQEYYEDIEKIISNSKQFNFKNNFLLSVTKKFENEFKKIKKILENPIKRKNLQLKYKKLESKSLKSEAVNQIQQRQRNIQFITTQLHKIPVIKRKQILSNLYTDKLTLKTEFFDIGDLNNLELIVLKNQLLKDKRNNTINKKIE